MLGFSDFQIARFVLNPTGNMEKENLAVRAHRKSMGIPVSYTHLFLKANSTELSNILAEFERIALVHPEVAF